MNFEVKLKYRLIKSLTQFSQTLEWSFFDVFCKKKIENTNA
jgi:hypothetical protein